MWNISALIVAKIIFDAIVLLLYGNLPTLKLKGFLLSYKDVFELDPHLRGDKGLEK